jgi:hypothetical protein
MTEGISILKKFQILVFWLVWSVSMGIIFGFILGDFKISFIIFMGFGGFLGVILQFVHIYWIRVGSVLICIVIAIVLVWKPVLSFYQRTMNQKISRDFLVEDVRQMASILEITHPDPYFYGGGKVAFHRRLQDIIRDIPEDGLTKIEFYHHLCPFLAAVGDGHTALWQPYWLNNQTPGGIPLYFQAVEDFLYVAGVIDTVNLKLIGSKLVAVENISMDELLARQARIKGADNQYQLMRYLGYDGSLWYKKSLEHLIPEWDGNAIHLELLDPSGNNISFTFEQNQTSLDHLITKSTTVELPSTQKSNYVYRFMDEKNKTVLLLIENMYTYRETFEMEMVLQGSYRKDLAIYLSEKYNGKSPPSGYREIIKGIPSATELCKELFQEMKSNRSENLIIDLRRNQGGNAFISTIFFYFLHGKEALIKFSDKKSIYVKKYSPLFWKQYPARDLTDINQHQSIVLNEVDYDFSGYPEPGHHLSREESIRIIEDEASLAATFWEEYQSEKYSGLYRPKNIFILCSPITNSSGYAFMYDHWAAGGKVVGIPSSQAGNSFGAWVGFKLEYSGLAGGISHLYITHFRDNPEMGKVFRPDFEMTYEDLKKYQFDPNAEILFALSLTKNHNYDD